MLLRCKMISILLVAPLFASLAAAPAAETQASDTRVAALRPSGPFVGLAAQTLLGPETGTSDAVFGTWVWGSAQAGWLFGDRFFHGPGMEAGFQHSRAFDSEFGPVGGVARDQFHFGLSYLAGVDFWREQRFALFINARIAVGIIPDEAPFDGVGGLLYGQAEASVGLRVAVGLTTLRFAVGPAAGIYAWYGFTSLQSSMAVGF